MTDFDTHGFTKGLNGRLGFDLAEWREGFARVTVDLDERHENRQGGIHGGVTAALIDAATGFCGIYEPDPDKRRGNVTVSLTVNYTGRPKSTRLTCTAEVLRSGRRIYFASASGARRHRKPDCQRRGGLRLRRPRCAAAHDGLKDIFSGRHHALGYESPTSSRYARVPDGDARNASRSSGVSMSSPMPGSSTTVGSIAMARAAARWG